MLSQSWRAITKLGAIEKSPILLSQYWKNEWLDGNIIILYFGGSNNINALYFIVILYYRMQPRINNSVHTIHQNIKKLKRGSLPLFSRLLRIRYNTKYSILPLRGKIFFFLQNSFNLKIHYFSLYKNFI